MKICYVLELEEEKIYVGYTVNFKRRMREHFNENESGNTQWCTRFKPKSLLYIMEGDQSMENILTLAYMELCGWENVRGGAYCQVKMKNAPARLEAFSFTRKGETLPLIGSPCILDQMNFDPVQDPEIDLTPKKEMNHFIAGEDYDAFLSTFRT